MDVGYWIESYGYVALVLGAFFEGESFVLAAGFAAHQGYLHLSAVILLASIGSAAGDQFYFWLGRKRGRTFLERRPAWQFHVEKVHLFLARYHTLAIFMFRFMYGLRSVTPFAIGLGPVKARRFLLLDSLAALAWGIVVTLIGFLFGAVLQIIIEDARRYEKWVVLSILALGAFIWIILTTRKELTKRFKKTQGTHL